MHLPAEEQGNILEPRYFFMGLPMEIFIIIPSEFNRKFYKILND